jgi:hypothetical protein
VAAGLPKDVFKDLVPEVQKTAIETNAQNMTQAAAAGAFHALLDFCRPPQ